MYYAHKLVKDCKKGKEQFQKKEKKDGQISGKKID